MQQQPGTYEDFLEHAKPLVAAPLDELADPEKLVPLMVKDSISSKSMYYAVKDAVVRVRLATETIKSVQSLQQSIDAGNDVATKLARRTFWLTAAILILTAVMAYPIVRPWFG